MADLSVYQRYVPLSEAQKVNKAQALQNKLVEAQTQRQLKAAATGGGSTPAALQIADKMFQLEKVYRNPNVSPQEREAALREYNLIGQAAKTYGFERLTEYGMPQGNIPIGGIELPVEDVTGQVIGNQTQPGQFDNLDQIMSEMGTPQTQPPQLPPVFRDMPELREVGGASDIMARREAKKSGASERAKLEQQLDIQPTIEAEKAREKSRAEYMESGFQALPKSERALRSAEVSAQNVMRVSDQVSNAASQAFTTGFTGSISGALPGTPAYNLRKNLETLEATAAFDTLKQMRANSPTGGALGNVTERELDLLKAAYSNLTNAQNYRQFQQNLIAFNNQYQASLQNMRDAYMQDYQRFGGSKDVYLPSPGNQATQTLRDEQPAQIQRGAVEDGYMFMGGNPSDPKSWKKVQ